MSAKKENDDAPEEKPVDDENPEVAITDEDEEPKGISLADDDDNPPEEKPTRAEKKRQRGQNLVQQARQEAETARREAAELRGRLDAFERQQQQRPAPADDKDPLEEETLAARKEYSGYAARYQAAAEKARGEKRSLTQQEIDAFESEGWAIKQKMDDISVRRSLAKHGPKPEVAEKQAAQQAAIARVRAAAGDLLGDARGARLFQAQWQLALAEGEPDTDETMHKAADAARRRLGLPPKSGRPAPTEATKRRLSAAPQSSISDKEDDARPIVFTRELRKLADAALPHIKDKNKRYQHYARTVGKELRKDGLA